MFPLKLSPGRSRTTTRPTTRITTKDKDTPGFDEDKIFGDAKAVVRALARMSAAQSMQRGMLARAAIIGGSCRSCGR
jgi:hypothetical protein